MVGAGGRSAADEEQLVGVLGAVRVALQVLLDHLARLRHELARLPAGLRGERVRVAVRWEHLAAHVVFDERERAAARRVVGVEYLAQSGVLVRRVRTGWMVAAVVQLGGAAGAGG